MKETPNAKRSACLLATTNRQHQQAGEWLSSSPTLLSTRRTNQTSPNAWPKNPRKPSNGRQPAPSPTDGHYTAISRTVNSWLARSAAVETWLTELNPPHSRPRINGLRDLPRSPVPSRSRPTLACSSAGSATASTPIAKLHRSNPSKRPFEPTTQVR